MKEPPAPANEARRLAVLATLGDLETLADDALDALVRVAAAVCDVPIAVVSLVDERRQRFVAKLGLAVDETARSISFCGHAILETETFVVPDAKEDERFADNPLVTGEPSVRFYAGSPLVVEEGLALGTLCVIDRRPRSLTPAQTDALRDLSLAVTRLLEARRAARRLVTTFDRELATREQLAVVLEKTPSMLAYWNPDFTARFANAAYERYFHPSGPVSGLHIREVIGERLYVENKPLLEAAFRGQSQRFERARRGPDGEPQIAIGEYTPDERDGVVCGVVVSLVDVSASRAATRELARRNDLLTMAEDVADLGHWRLDIETDTVFWSPQVYRIMGIEPSTFAPTRANAIDAYHPEDRARVGELVARAIELGQPFEFELRVVRPDGETRFVHSRGRCDRRADGKTAAVFGVIQDVTARKRDESAIATLQQRIARQSAIYETMLRHMPRGAVMLVDRDLRYLSLQGPSVSDVLTPGLDPGAVVGRRVEDVVSEGNRAQVLDTYRETLAGRSLHMEATRGTRAFEVRTAPIYDGEDEPVAALAYLYDITERKAAAATLERSVREKETLLKEIHHRVKNNLQVVGSILSLHSHRTADPAVRGVLAEVKGRVHAIALLHERIYRSTDLASIDLLEYVRGLTADVARVAGTGRGGARVSGASVLVDMDAAVPVGLVVNELVTNAFKHGTSAGGAPVSIEVRVAPLAESVRVAVEDDGPGPPPADATDPPRSLGMFLVASLAEQLGGSFRLTCEGGITRAELLFPRRGTHAA